MGEPALRESATLPRRLSQAACLALFLALLWLAAFPLPSGLPHWLPLGLFQLLDPVLLPVSALAARDAALLFAAWPALAVLALTPVLGRVFCSHVCPLGTTLDAVRSSGRGPGRAVAGRWRNWKHLVLAAMVVAAAMGLSLVHWGAPLSLAPRLYGLVLGPALGFALDALPGVPGWGSRHYATLIFMVPWLAGLVALTAVAPRFWCRCLCPAGALLSLCARRPLARRTVSEACTACGRCVRRCPMGAIAADDPRTTNHAECIGCRTCRAVCPEDAVSFPLVPSAARSASVRPLLPGRRAVLGAAATGLGLAFVGARGLPEHRDPALVGDVMPGSLVRPPGALPEADFLHACLRCGLCMKACPTNMLQPAGLDVGFSPLFTPLAVARRGACEPLCNACGHVCPSGAIRALDLAERRWAKMGTAVIRKELCLAWEMDKACLVCDEACPFDAVDLVRLPARAVAVPVVREQRCAGCGWCENKCPVRAEAAIRVTPMLAQRVGSGSYRDLGRAQGLDIQYVPESDRPVGVPELDPGLPPPGFDG